MIPISKLKCTKSRDAKQRSGYKTRVSGTNGWQGESRLNAFAQKRITLMALVVTGFFTTVYKTEKAFGGGGGGSIRRWGDGVLAAEDGGGKSSFLLRMTAPSSEDSLLIGCGCGGLGERSMTVALSFDWPGRA